MKRAKLILDLVKKKDDLDNENFLATLEDKEQTKTLEIEDLFQDKYLYESAPASAVFSPDKEIPPIQPSYSAPLLGEPDLEQELIEQSDSSLDKEKKNHVESREFSKSPLSIISGIEPLASSSEHDFSDSSASWYLDSEEERERCKKTRRIFVPASSSDSSDDDQPVFKRARNEAQPGSSQVNRNITSPDGINSTSEVAQTITMLVEYSSDADNTTSNTPHSSAANNNDKEPTRWKKSDPSKWKKNLSKSNRHNCLPYEGKKGKNMPAKMPKPVNCDKCKFCCTHNFSEDDRLNICKSYWSIIDFVAQKQFLLYNMTSAPVKTHKAQIPDNKHRSVAIGYYFKKNENRHRVCKNFFLKTLCISNGPVNKALQQQDDFGNFIGQDKRGSHEPINKTDMITEQKVIEHINSFPRMESHYCRKTSKRQYLVRHLSIAKMYELYQTKTVAAGEEPCSLYVYKRIFGCNFNLSFFIPKKDLCLVCSLYDSSGRPENLKIEYEAHIERKTSAQEAKELDKERSIKDETYLVVTADMQSTLHIPVCGVGVLYYTRKLNVQNYTIYTAKPPHDAYCITWNETNGKKGSNEIATAIDHWISQLPSTIKEVTIYSDTCAGQNRNQYITAFLIHLIQKDSVHLEVLEQKYLESGHTHMEVDSMHSSIEREQRHTSVYSMIDWKNIMERARSKRHRESAPPYVVKELLHDEILDVRALNEAVVRNTTHDTDGKKLTWLKFKCLRFEKQRPGVVKFRYSHEGPYSEFNVQQIYNGPPKPLRRTKRRKGLISDEPDNHDDAEDWINKIKAYPIPKAYPQALPISEAKKKDLLNLCTKGVIPRELHSWYQSLPTNKVVIDRLCEPDVTETDEEVE